MIRISRQIWVATATLVAILISACGSEVGEPAATSPAVDQQTLVQEDNPATPPTEVSAAEPVSDVTPTDPPVANLPEGATAVNGTMTFEWTPACSMGPPFTVDPADCETFGGYTIVPTVLPVVRTGTLDGIEQFHVTLVVAPDGEYAYAGISSFVGTVADCGEGTVVFNTSGAGRFDVEQSAKSGTLVSGPFDAISYSPTLSELSTLDALVDLEMTSTGPTSLNVTGTLICGDALGDLENIDPVRPESGVSTTDSFAWTGSSSFAVGPTCRPTSDATAVDACPTDDNFTYLGLFNSLDGDGALDGQSRFIGTNIMTADGKYEHSGIAIFEGTVEGCGTGTVIMSNEAAGSIYSPAFTHQRGFSPVQFHTGTLDVYVDGWVTITGLASGDMSGTYSC